MFEYRVVVKETLSKVVTIEAECEQDAINKVIDQHTEETIILDSSDFDDVDIRIEGK